MTKYFRFAAVWLLKKIAGKEKGYFADTGFLCYLQRIGTSESIGSHPLKGSLFETYVVMEIFKTFQAWPIKPNLYHFRTYSGAEVDLILEFGKKVWVVEIKSSSREAQ